LGERSRLKRFGRGKAPRYRKEGVDAVSLSGSQGMSGGKRDSRGDRKERIAGRVWREERGVPREAPISLPEK